MIPFDTAQSALNLHVLLATVDATLADADIARTAAKYGVTTQLQEATR